MCNCKASTWYYKLHAFHLELNSGLNQDTFAQYICDCINCLSVLTSQWIGFMVYLHCQHTDSDPNSETDTHPKNENNSDWVSESTTESEIRVCAMWTCSCRVAQVWNPNPSRNLNPCPSNVHKPLILVYFHCQIKNLVPFFYSVDSDHVASVRILFSFICDAELLTCVNRNRSCTVWTAL